jgi:hypothetical protein
MRNVHTKFAKKIRQSLACTNQQEVRTLSSLKIFGIRMAQRSVHCKY